ncbi:MAG: TrkA family potassium uptake protein [Bryobacteraceae bacterium]
MGRFVRRAVYFVSAVGLTLLFGTAGFTLIEGWPLFDSFYMTLTTMATVGYREIHDLSAAGRIFNIFVIMFGVGTMFVGIGIITQSVIEIELGDVLGRRRLKRMIENLQDHFIVCGFGRVGRGAADELKEAGVPFVVIDRDPERVERALAAGMIALNADSTRDETLRQVRVERARGMVAALATDADNLFLLLSAKALNPALYVAARAAEEGADAKMRRAGADAVFAPYAITGHRLAQSLLRPHVVTFLDFATSHLAPGVTMEQVRVSGNSEVAGKTLQQMQIGRDLGVIVLAIRKEGGEMLFNPPAQTAISGGDYLIRSS